jgi:hypothetical protein
LTPFGILYIVRLHHEQRREGVTVPSQHLERHAYLRKGGGPLGREWRLGKGRLREKRRLEEEGGPREEKHHHHRHTCGSGYAKDGHMHACPASPENALVMRPISSLTKLFQGRELDYLDPSQKIILSCKSGVREREI